MGADETINLATTPDGLEAFQRDKGRINLAPLLTGVHDAEDAVSAFDQAADKSRAMKVQICFVGA